MVRYWPDVSLEWFLCSVNYSMDKEESQTSGEAMKTACEKGDFEKVFELIKAGQDPRCSLPRNQNRKPLHYAAFYAWEPGGGENFN